jgi:hypothetical protein
VRRGRGIYLCEKKMEKTGERNRDGYGEQKWTGWRSEQQSSTNNHASSNISFRHAKLPKSLCAYRLAILRVFLEERRARSHSHSKLQALWEKAKCAPRPMQIGRIKKRNDSLGNGNKYIKTESSALNKCLEFIHSIPFWYIPSTQLSIPFSKPP